MPHVAFAQEAAGAAAAAAEKGTFLTTHGAGWLGGGYLGGDLACRLAKHRTQCGRHVRGQPVPWSGDCSRYTHTTFLSQHANYKRSNRAL